MQTLVITNQKGGVGKTTLAAHLSVAAESAGLGPVAIVDTDPQGSLAAWWNKRAASTPSFTTVVIDDLTAHLAQLAEVGIKLVIIDTPPAITATISAVMRRADLILIPTRPSPLDLEAVGATITLATEARKRMVFVINGAANRARITGEAAVALSQFGTVAPVTLYQRTDFASAMVDGRTAPELNSTSKASEEVGQLWKYVATQLRKRG